MIGYEPFNADRLQMLLYMSALSGIWPLQASVSKGISMLAVVQM